VPDCITIARLGNDAVCEDGSVGVADCKTVAHLGNNAVCEDGGVGMPDCITSLAWETMPYVRMEVFGCPII